MTTNIADIAILLKHLTDNTEEVNEFNWVRLVHDNQTQLRDKAFKGMPATFYIGSDSYAETVDIVTRFKSGKKAGQVKSIITERGREYVVKSNGIATRREYTSGRFVVGYARDYRDPSF